MNEQSDQLLQLQQHLQSIQDAPTTPLDEKLIDTCIYALAPTLQGQDRQSLVLTIYQFLPTLQQDPTPLVRLLSKLLEPIPLSLILSLDPPVDFVSGLQIGATAFNTLTLSLLEKADGNSARTLASAYPALFIALVDLWLSTQDEGVADQAGRVLLHLLRIDLPDSGTLGLDGPVWRRFFSKDVYTRLFEITSGKSQILDRSRTTIAQARLLDWLPAVGSLDWNAISQSYHPSIESSYGLPNNDSSSLLSYATIHMVDYKKDVLMHRTLISCFESLLKINPDASLETSPSLQFLTQSGLHKRTIDYYIHPNAPSHDPLDLSFLLAPAANYIATWSSTYPLDLASPTNKNNTAIRKKIIERIANAVNVSAARWAHAHSPSEDLHVLASLPRSLLVGLGEANPVLSLPSRAANEEALKCLATIFHGALREEITIPPRPTRADEEDELKAAQALYSQYLTHNERLWSDIVTHADTIALAPQALAAINLVRAVLTARWGGVEAIMEGAAKSAVVPWLLSPPKTFSNLVVSCAVQFLCILFLSLFLSIETDEDVTGQGGHGDAENAAYRIASAKFDVLRVLFERIKGVGEYEEVGRVAEQRLREGPWGSGGQVGGRIATLEL